MYQLSGTRLHQHFSYMYLSSARVPRNELLSFASQQR
jgi:hypothetical protein